jgi:sugar phosphate isomerase/epimerase
LSLAEAAALAASQGYEALEVRSGPRGSVQTDASEAQRRRWRRQLDQSGAQALSVASYVRICDGRVGDETAVEHGLANLRLAHDLGASWVRVFAGGPRDVPVTKETDERGRRRLRRLLHAGLGLGVRIALETHDSHPTARDVLRVLGDEDLLDVAVIWDVLHTWLHGEDPTATTAQLGKRLAYVQVKDVASRNDLSPLPLGAGVLPLHEAVRLAVQAQVPWVSWEYERAWFQDAAPLSELGHAARRWLGNAAADGQRLP